MLATLLVVVGLASLAGAGFLLTRDNPAGNRSAFAAIALAAISIAALMGLVVIYGLPATLHDPAES